MSLLFSPLNIKSVTFRNRITISPMCQYSSIDGFATDWHLVHLGSRAVGGAGLVMQEATAVSPEGRISPGDMGIYKDEHIEKLKSISSFIRSQGAVAGIQLAHAGRKASTHIPWEGNGQIAPDAPNGWQTVAPSAIPFTTGWQTPVEMDDVAIQKVIDDYRSAAARAVHAGYQVPFAEKIKKETGMRTGAVGMITSAQQAESILENGQADLIFMAREALRNPYVALNMAHELGEDVEWPKQYLRGKPA